MIDGEYNLDTMAIGTFHSICLKILKSHITKIGFKSNPSIYDTDDSSSLIRKLLLRHYSWEELQEKRLTDGKVLSAISRAKNKGIDPEEFSRLAGWNSEYSTPSHIAAKKVYGAYQNTLKQNNAFDFDDMLFLVVKLFRDYPDVLETYRALWKYILCDEMQDTSYIQYVILKLLAANHRNLFAVADAGQSIYGFRTAEIKNIKTFLEDFKDTTNYQLAENFRSTRTIVAAAKSVLAHNKDGFNLNSVSNQAKGEPVYLLPCDTVEDEGIRIIQEVIKRKAGGILYKEMAVLYRTNYQSRAIEEAFFRRAIPYRVVKGLSFYDRREIKDLLSYLKLIHNPDDGEAFERVVNVPKRGIGVKTLQQLIQDAARQEKSPLSVVLDSADGVYPKLKAFGMLYEQFRGGDQTPGVLLRRVIDGIGYRAYINTFAEDTAEDRWENIGELITMASRYDTLEAFLDDIYLLKGGDEDTGDKRDVVSLMTFHSMKGLETDVVFCAGMEENVFPHQRSLYPDPEDPDQRSVTERIEEERRLAYVAFSRPRKVLYLSYARERAHFGKYTQNEVSRFVSEIDEELIKVC
jgi:DNA helicase-2/ATP-dependent DNA helicase PcrA